MKRIERGRSKGGFSEEEGLTSWTCREKGPKMPSGARTVEFSNMTLIFNWGKNDEKKKRKRGDVQRGERGKKREKGGLLSSNRRGKGKERKKERKETRGKGEGSYGKRRQEYPVVCFQESYKAHNAVINITYIGTVKNSLRRGERGLLCACVGEENEKEQKK